MSIEKRLKALYNYISRGDGMDKAMVLEYIAQADEMDIHELMDAVLDRYHVIYPEWEINTFVLPRSLGEERTKRFEKIVSFMKRHGGV